MLSNDKTTVLERRRNTRRAVITAVVALVVVAAPVVGPVSAASDTPGPTTAASSAAVPAPAAANAPPADEESSNSTTAGTPGNESAPSESESAPARRWSKTIGGDADDKLATGLKVDGGYLVVGWSNSSAEDSRDDGYVALLDRAGGIEWKRTYGGPGTDRIFDVERMGDGYLVAGMASRDTDSAWDGWLMRLGPNGDKRWQETYGGIGPEAFWSVERTGDRIHAAGWKRDGGLAEGWVLTANRDGDAVRSETFDTARSGTDEYFNSIFVTEGGDLLLTGSVVGGIGDPGDAWAVKLREGGRLEWRKFFGDTRFDRIHDATAASDGGFVLAGRTASRGSGGENGWILKIRGDGKKEWVRTYGTDERDAFFGIHAASDGGYVVSGAKHIRGAGGADGWMLKTDADGRKSWERTYGEGYWDKFWPVVDGHGGGYLAVGESTSFGQHQQGWLVRVGGPAVAAIEDADANGSGTTVTLDGSPVRAVTLSSANVSGVLAVAEEADPATLSPPGDPLYAVTMDGPETAANGSATVEFTVRPGAVEADLSDVRVAERTADGWSVLETRVVSEANGTAVVAAETAVGATLAVTSVPAPTANVTVPESVLVGESAELSASGSTAEVGTLSSYQWSVGGESLAGETADVSFDSLGERTVTLTVTDPNGLSDTATAALMVNDRPEVDLQTPDVATVGKSATLSADVSDEVGNVTVTWRFGDASVTGASVEHSFGSPGNRTVTVVVEDEYGATVTEQVEIEVDSQRADTATIADDSDGGVPGFGVGTALAALAAAALLAVRRRGS